ncbi:MAG: MMPL family transporter, partial [Lachnospiraceae bacterium]|nr:MMPL family transporter [Lachnospiraceae bacterium]
DELCSEKLDGEYYLIGSTPMAVEMSKSFKSELNKITLITAIAIFIVVLVTFKNIMIPLILVLLIQCSVYITMFVMSVMGADMNYLALLIVQSLLMGATIDYAIVFTNFYIEKRLDRGKKEALISTYKASIRTILTSGMIMVFITWIMGYVFEDPSVGQICHIISIGVACALVMILFFLPAILAACDRVIVPKRASTDQP